MTTNHVFLGDSAFVDRRLTFHPGYRAGGIGNLSLQGTSFFNNLQISHDVRDIEDRDVWWTAETKPLLAVDAEPFDTFWTQLQAISSGDRDKLFQILDRAVFKYDVSEDIEDVETALDAISIYKPNSIVFSTTTTIGPVYFDDGSPTQSVRVPDWARFTITVTIASVATDIIIQVWSNSAAFVAGYPITNITAVIPPLPYDRLLTDNLLGTGANSFQTAAQISSLNVSKLQQQIEDTDITGYIQHQVRVYDTAGNVAAAYFLIAYKGQVPDRIEIRDAIQEDLLSSGVGTEAAWRARIPEIFVNSRFYLTPIWDNTTTRPDQIIFPSIINMAAAISKTKLVLPGVDVSLVDPNIEVLSAAYEMVILTAVPHELNVDEGLLSLKALHPTYQAYAPTDPNFNYMTTSTKQFANTLISVLAIAKGVAEDTLYPPFTEPSTGMIYIPFDVGDTEFLVLTRESYLNTVGD